MHEPGCEDFLYRIKEAGLRAALGAVLVRPDW
jgi:hypothetical protein